MAILTPYRRKGRGAWYVDLGTVKLPDGTRRRFRCVRCEGRTLTQRRAWAERERARLAIEGPRVDIRREVPKLSEFVPTFLETLRAQGRVGENWIARQEVALRVHVVPALGEKAIDQIGNRDVDRLIATMREGGAAASTINNTLCPLSRLLQLAVRWGYLERVSCTIELLPREGREDQVHTFEEARRLVMEARELGHDAYVIVLLGLHAGLRAGEIMGVRWADVDLRDGVLHVRVSLTAQGHEKMPKSGRTRTVPLTRTLAEALREHRTRVGLRSERVLSDETGAAVTHKWLKVRVLPALRRAGLETRRPLHTLRRNFVTELQHREVPEVAIQEWAGHESAGMTRRYTTLSRERQATWIQRLEEPPAELEGASGEPAAALKR